MSVSTVPVDALDAVRRCERFPGPSSSVMAMAGTNVPTFTVRSRKLWSPSADGAGRGVSSSSVIASTFGVTATYLSRSFVRTGLRGSSVCASAHGSRNPLSRQSANDPSVTALSSRRNSCAQLDVGDERRRAFGEKQWRDSKHARRTVSLQAFPATLRPTSGIELHCICLSKFEFRKYVRIVRQTVWVVAGQPPATA